jgi:hypothetical protein
MHLRNDLDILLDLFPPSGETDEHETTTAIDILSYQFRLEREAGRSRRAPSSIDRRTSFGISVPTTWRCCVVVVPLAPRASTPRVLLAQTTTTTKPRKYIVYRIYILAGTPHAYALIRSTLPAALRLLGLSFHLHTYRGSSRFFQSKKQTTTKQIPS